MSDEIRKEIQKLAEAFTHEATPEERSLSVAWHRTCIEQLVTAATSALQKENEELRKEIFLISSRFSNHTIEHLAEQLAQALEELRDYQNGCPLPSYEDGWGNAMKLTEEALAAYRSTHPRKENQ